MGGVQRQALACDFPAFAILLALAGPALFHFPFFGIVLIALWRAEFSTVHRAMLRGLVRLGQSAAFLGSLVRLLVDSAGLAQSTRLSTCCALLSLLVADKRRVLSVQRTTKGR